MSEQSQTKDREWITAGDTESFPRDIGIAVKAGNLQIAVFRFTATGEWYACDNRCPHKGDMVMARGLIGDRASKPFVACPMHKKVFSLENGACLNDDSYSVSVYPVKVENGQVLISIPSRTAVGI